MEYLNEDNFKDLDTFITSCEDKQAAIGDVNVVVAAIDAAEVIPINHRVVLAGNLKLTDEETIEYYEAVIAQGVELSDHETFMYTKLLNEQGIVSPKE